MECIWHFACETAVALLALGEMGDQMWDDEPQHEHPPLPVASSEEGGSGATQPTTLTLCSPYNVRFTVPKFGGMLTYLGTASFLNIQAHCYLHYC